MTAAFLDENLPDGTRLRPGTKFIKYWKMRNTGTISWSADTKVKKIIVVQSALFSWDHLDIVYPLGNISLPPSSGSAESNKMKHAVLDFAGLFTFSDAPSWARNPYSAFSI